MTFSPKNENQTCRVSRNPDICEIAKSGRFWPLCGVQFRTKKLPKKYFLENQCQNMIKQHSCITHTKKLSNISCIRGEIHVFIGFFMKKGLQNSDFEILAAWCGFRGGKPSKMRKFHFFSFFCLIYVQMHQIRGSPPKSEDRPDFPRPLKIPVGNSFPKKKKLIFVIFKKTTHFQYTFH